MEKNKYFILIGIVITILSVFLNYKVWNSNVVQVQVVSEFNTKKLSDEGFLKLENLDRNFPNLSATSFPIPGFYAKYHVSSEDYYNGLKILNQETRDNPYLFFKESLKAEAYNKLGIRDSAFYYSKIAYENLPGNSRHYEQYITELVFNKDLKTIKDVFRESRFKSNKEYWLIYFAAVIRLKDKNDQEIENFAKQAIQKFGNDQQLKTISSYILHGEDNIIKSYQLMDQGIKDFELNKFKDASEKFIKAYELNPEDYSIVENIGMSLTKLKEYQKATEYFKIVVNDMKPQDGKSYFGLATCYAELNYKEKACENLLISMEYNYRPSFVLYSKICKQ